MESNGVDLIKILWKSIEMMKNLKEMVTNRTVVELSLC
jgi:hypothetical protein